MKPSDLLETAEILIHSSAGKPKVASLRRAISSCYYAMFHCLSRHCADLLVGGPGASMSKPAWHQVYRALEHGPAKERCKNQAMIKKFPKEIEDFANTFVAMQDKRHRADYNPSAKFVKSEVILDHLTVEGVIENFKKASVADRRAFCVYMLLRSPRS